MSKPTRRGRPTLAEQAERDANPITPDSVQAPATPEAEQTIACSRCGCLFIPRVIRTREHLRDVRCNRCGYTYGLGLDVARKLGWVK